MMMHVYHNQKELNFLYSDTDLKSSRLLNTNQKFFHDVSKIINFQMKIEFNLN